MNHVTTFGRVTGSVAAVVLTMVAVCVFAAIVFAFTYIGTSNHEIGLRNQAAAQTKVCEAYFDKMWKVIQQVASVKDDAKDTYAAIYPALIGGRYGDEKGGALMRWIQESNPAFDMSIWNKLAAAIEGQREGFFREQAKLLDIKREHDNALRKWPGSWLLAGRRQIEVVTITSEQTEQVFATGRENAVESFRTGVKVRGDDQ